MVINIKERKPLEEYIETGYRKKDTFNFRTAGSVRIQLPKGYALDNSWYHTLITFMVPFLAARLDKTLVEKRDTVTVE